MVISAKEMNILIRFVLLSAICIRVLFTFNSWSDRVQAVRFSRMDYGRRRTPPFARRDTDKLSVSEFA